MAYVLVDLVAHYDGFLGSGRSCNVTNAPCYSPFAFEYKVNPVIHGRYLEKSTNTHKIEVRTEIPRCSGQNAIQRPTISDNDFRDKPQLCNTSTPSDTLSDKSSMCLGDSETSTPVFWNDTLSHMSHENTANANRQTPQSISCLVRCSYCDKTFSRRSELK